MSNSEQVTNLDSRRLVGLSWIAKRWACSRQTCRRVLQRHGILPFFLGGDVDDDHPFGDADLRSRQTHAIGFLERVEEVLDESPGFGVDLIYGVARTAQDLRPEFDDFA